LVLISVSIIAENGGEIFIGHQAVNNTGSLIIPNKTKLIIGDGGVVTIDDLSNITVNNGGILEIHSGGTLIVKGDGRVTIENDGKFIVHKDANIILENEMTEPLLINEAVGSVINLMGELKLQGGIIMIQGDGFLRFGPGHKILSSTNEINFASDDILKTSYRVDNDLIVQNKKLVLNTAKFLLNNDIVITEDEFLITGSHLYSNIREVLIPGGDIQLVGGGEVLGIDINSSSIINTTLFDVPVNIDRIQGP
jgi:hypothetical protein